MVTGFFAAPPGCWAVVRELIAVDRWPLEAVIIDLRYWQDQELCGLGKMPGGRTLAKAWGWTHSQVRTLLANVGSWSDPRKLPEWTGDRSHTDRTPIAQESHTHRTPVAHPSHTDRTPAQGTSLDTEDKSHTHRTDILGS